MKLLTLLALPAAVSGHFLLNYPPTIGFDDDLETTAPCGSFTPDFSKDNVTSFYVDGSAVAMTSIHAQTVWLFRATLDTTASGGWAVLLPSVEQTGLGAYCEEQIRVPAQWAGKQGILGVVQDAPDGILYQCAAVNFVAGAQPSVPSICTNVTGLSASFAADPALSTAAATGTAVGPPTTTAPATTTTTTTVASTTSAASTTSPASKSQGAALRLSQWGGLGVTTSVVITGLITFAACLI